MCIKITLKTDVKYRWVKSITNQTLNIYATNMCFIKIVINNYQNVTNNVGLLLR